MAINRWLGLGLINNPFDIAGSVTVAEVDGGNGKKDRIIVDHAKASDEGVNRLTNFSSSPTAISNHSLPPWASEKSKNHPLLIPEATPLVLSQESSFGHTDTLFRDLDLQCFPFYNFWVSDEETNDEQDVGDRKLTDVPRFVKLSWKRAPELPGTPLKDNDGRLRRRVVEQSLPHKSFYSRGINFEPDHMQAANFQIPRLATANRLLSPGVLSAVVEIPGNDTQNALEDIINESDLIDEDAFLDHPDTDGMGIFELKMNAKQASDPLIQSANLGSEGLPSAASVLKGNGFDGRFSIQRPSKFGDSMRISGIDPDSGITLNTKTAHTDTEEDDHVIEIIRKVSEPPKHKPQKNGTFVKVKFIDPGVVNIASPDRLRSIRRPEHAENILAISTFLPHLAVMSFLGPPSQDKDYKEILARLPSFPAPIGLKPLEYVGYVIEKSRMRNGIFEVVDTIDIPDRDTTEYYDSKIVYGETYRYRIRVLLRWTRDVDADLNSDVFVSFKNSQTNKLFPCKSSYFHGEWSAPWAYVSVLDTTPPPPPDEFTVRTESAKRRVIITMKFPEDSQRDILKMRLYRKLQNLGGEDLTGWEVIADHFPAKNSIYVDNDVYYVEDNGVRYVYAAQTISRHKELSRLSEQLAARLNRNWKIFGEHPTEFVSNSGVKTAHFGAFAVKPFAPRHNETILPFVRTNELSDQFCSISFSGRERFSFRPSDDRNYVIRVESLDTGEIVEEYLNLRLEKIKENIRILRDHRKLSIVRPIFDKVFPTLGKLF